MLLGIASNRFLPRVRQLAIICVALLLMMSTVQAAHACATTFDDAPSATSERGVGSHAPCSLCMTPHGAAPNAEPLALSWTLIERLDTVPIERSEPARVPFSLLVRPPPCN